MGKALAKPLLRTVGEAVKHVGKEATYAAAKAALEQIHRPFFSASVSAACMQDVHGRAVEAADVSLHEIPHDLPKAHAKTLINAAAEAAAFASYTAFLEIATITSKDAAEETAAGAAADAAAKNAFHAVVKKEQREEKNNLHTNIDSVDIEHQEKESQAQHEVIDFIKDFLLTIESFKADILLNLTEGRTNPKFDICTNGLFKTETQIRELQTWIHSHHFKSIQPDAEALNSELQQIEQFLEPLIAGMGNLQRLSMSRQQKHTKEFTDPQLDTLKQCLAKVNTSFEILAGYIIGKKSVSGHELDSVPISISEKGVLHLETFL